MTGDVAAIPIEAENALRVVRHYLGDSLVAVWLHGSAVAGGLRPNSDVDVLVVLGRPTTRAVRRRLVSELMKISGSAADASGRRPLELIVVLRSDLVAPTCPARAELVYGEWLREAFEAGEVPEPVLDPELILLLAQARREAVPLIGPAPSELLPIVPEAELRRAIGNVLPALLATLEGDERNVVLTLARMWRTLARGDFVPKDVAAQWAIPRLSRESAALVAHARDAYLGVAQDDWHARRRALRHAVDELHARVTAML